MTLAPNRSRTDHIWPITRSRSQPDPRSVKLPITSYVCSGLPITASITDADHTDHCDQQILHFFTFAFYLRDQPDHKNFVCIFTTCEKPVSAESCDLQQLAKAAFCDQADHRGKMDILKEG